MGGITAPVTGSGADPAWMARVSNREDEDELCIRRFLGSLGGRGQDHIGNDTGRGCRPRRPFCNTAAMTSKDRKARPERPAYAGRQPRKPRPAKAAPSSAAAPATGKATGNATRNATGNATRNATGNATGNAAPKAGEAAPVS